MEQKQGIVLHKDNPFKDDVDRMLKTQKSTSRTVTAGGLISERVTVTMEKTYLPIGFSKIYQNKEKLGDLSPYACKVLIHIATNLGYEDQFIKMTHKNVGIDHRAFNKALVELMSQRIVSRKCKSQYWVNITVIITGRIRPIENE